MPWPIVSPNTILDLFGGTGALTCVCQRLGAKHISTLDIDPAHHANTLPREAFDNIPRGDYDLVILDPFIEQVSTVALLLIPQLAHHSKWILWNMGYMGHRATFESILSSVDGTYQCHYRMCVNDIFIALLRARAGGRTGKIEQEIKNVD